MWRGNLRALDWERSFIGPFRDKSHDGGYVGLGKTLSGLTHVARLVGGEAGELRAGVVGDLLSTQDADGYIGSLAAPSRTCRLWDVHEQAYVRTAALDKGLGPLIINFQYGCQQQLRTPNHVLDIHAFRHITR